MPVSTTRRAVVRLRQTPRESVADDLAVEAPLTLILDGEPLATLMRSPGHDLELAAGWLTVESGVRGPSDIQQLRESRDSERVLISLAPGVQAPRPRAFVTSSSCGVCSADVLETALLRRWPAAPADWRISRDIVQGLPESMREQQRAFARTGGVHAAALATVEGELLVVREDVGRHNATDKVIGWGLLQHRLPMSSHVLVVSGRVSFEIVQKAVAAGVAAIVAVSAPTSLALDLSREHELLLAGMVRSGRMNLYSRADAVTD
ncbi:FdhD protein [Jatrophihabitans sp. GAS493]|uniref:formate dehydrogenase accessory sulfurtransferase FdhD n=1 Tax=Jatrophihabitans sp. GAS493 TaxID=1907575 RepID=UPI000BB75FD7|nr:formate dehydrogenase accessory sulfurtransferase FdhD [Jatrophihabitans sp. GAS493]SOD73665.1 FdhD protein [Jatrophihabitans sp. GAS493]